VIFPEVYMGAVDLLKSDEPLLVRGNVDAAEDPGDDGEGQGGGNGRPVLPAVAASCWSAKCCRSRRCASG